MSPINGRAIHSKCKTRMDTDILQRQRYKDTLHRDKDTFGTTTTTTEGQRWLPHFSLVHRMLK